MSGDHHFTDIPAVFEPVDCICDRLGVREVNIVAYRLSSFSVGPISLGVGISGSKQSDSDNIPVGCRYLGGKFVLVFGFFER